MDFTDADLKKLFDGVEVSNKYDHSLESRIAEIINRPSDYKFKLQRAKRRRRWGIIGMCIMLPVYLGLLVYTQPDGHELKIMFTASALIIAVLCVFMYSIFRVQDVL